MLELHSALDLRVLLIEAALELPPLGAVVIALIVRELWQFTAMDTDCNITKLRVVFLDHLLAPLLIQNLHRHGRLWVVYQQAQPSVLSIIHPGIAILMIANIPLHTLELTKHLTPAVEL